MARLAPSNPLDRIGGGSEDTCPIEKLALRSGHRLVRLSDKPLRTGRAAPIAVVIGAIEGGAVLSSNNSAAQPTPRNRWKEPNPWIGIGIAALALIVSIVGAIYSGYESRKEFAQSGPVFTMQSAQAEIWNLKRVAF